MSIQMVSISHKTATLHIRERFAFSKEEQIDILRTINTCESVCESVMIATCNRTEIYTYTDRMNVSREVFEWIQKVLQKYTHLENENEIVSYLRFHSDKKAIHHLFEVTCGLDSMVMGEDQILGQVKEAHAQAMEHHLCGTYLNALFRYAVTASKKVKTDTQLSKTPVSTASVSIKTAEQYVGHLEGKNVLVLGATGKIGSIVVKNLLADYKPNLYVAVRGIDGPSKVVDDHRHYSYEQIPYGERYAYLKDMDVVFSATSSPHYTLTYEEVRQSIEPGRKMAFVDLAVPLDIESRIAALDNIACFNIDDISKTAQDNNRKKDAEASAARDILSDYETQFTKWLLFQQALPVMRTVKLRMLMDVEQKGIDIAIDRLFYKIRECVDEESLDVFLHCLEESLEE